MVKKQIKLFDPFIDNSEINATIKTLRSHFWASGAGTNNVSKFEIQFRKFVGSKQCIAVNSGTAALHLALSLINLKGKEVILPSLSFVSTAHAVIYNGGKPIFVDVNKNNLCVDQESIEKSITSQTKIILPVHFAGMPCKMNEILKLCDEHKLILVEDAAHAAGSFYHNKRIGSHGDMVCFSFHPIKNLAMPGGGAITLNTKNFEKMKDLLNSRRWCGISNRQGVNYDSDWYRATKKIR